MEKALKKTITWRCVALATTSVIGYAFTGSVTIGAAMSVTLNLINSVIYYCHERAWGD